MHNTMEKPEQTYKYVTRIDHVIQTPMQALETLLQIRSKSFSLEALHFMYECTWPSFALDPKEGP